jgi:predicted nucleic acid-binding protein
LEPASSQRWRWLWNTRIGSFILDDGLARRIGQAAGLKVWGTLRILLEAKAAGLTDSISPFLNKLDAAGMWMSRDIRERVLALAGERLPH